MYTVSPEDHYLAGVISKFSDYIQTSSKTPLKLLTSAPKQSIKKESYDLKGAKLELTVTPGGAQVRGSTPPGGSSGPGCSPAAGWVNLVLLGAPAPSYVAPTRLASSLMKGLLTSLLLQNTLKISLACTISNWNFSRMLK